MANKGYLETTFPDGTPVKIYPVNNSEDMLKRYLNHPKVSYEKYYNIGHENQTGLVVDLDNFLMVGKKALESLCKQVLEATCADGAEYGVGSFIVCPFCTGTATNTYNNDIDQIEHEEDCAYNIAKDLLDDKGLQQSVPSTPN